MKGRFPKDSLLWTTLAIAVLALVGIGFLYVAQIPRDAKVVLYYLCFFVLMGAGIAYNIVSLQKGRWLFMKLRKMMKGEEPEDDEK